MENTRIRNEPLTAVQVRLLYLEKESVDDTVLKLQEDMIRMQDDHKFLEDKVHIILLSLYKSKLISVCTEWSR